MAKTKIEIELSRNDEFALMSRFGRRNSPEGLVRRAIQETVARQVDNQVIFEAPKTTKNLADTFTENLTGNNKETDSQLFTSPATEPAKDLDAGN